MRARNTLASAVRFVEELLFRSREEVCIEQPDTALTSKGFRERFAVIPTTRLEESDTIAGVVCGWPRRRV